VVENDDEDDDADKKNDDYNDDNLYEYADYGDYDNV